MKPFGKEIFITETDATKLEKLITNIPDEYILDILIKATTRQTQPATYDSLKVSELVTHLFNDIIKAQKILTINTAETASYERSLYTVDFVKLSNKLHNKVKAALYYYKDEKYLLYTSNNKKYTINPEKINQLEAKLTQCKTIIDNFRTLDASTIDEKQRSKRRKYSYNGKSAKVSSERELAKLEQDERSLLEELEKKKREVEILEVELFNIQSLKTKLREKIKPRDYSDPSYSTPNLAFYPQNFTPVVPIILPPIKDSAQQIEISKQKDHTTANSMSTLAQPIVHPKIGTSINERSATPFWTGNQINRKVFSGPVPQPTTAPVLRNQR